MWFVSHVSRESFWLLIFCSLFSWALTYRDQHCNKVTARVLNKRQTYTNGDTHVICVYKVYFTNRMPLRYDCYIHGSGFCCCLMESSVSGCHSHRLFPYYLLASSAETTHLLLFCFYRCFVLIPKPKKNWWMWKENRRIETSIKIRIGSFLLI